MAAEPRRLEPAGGRGLSLQRERELAALVDRYHDGPDEHGVDLAAAVVRWAFECGDVGFVPASEAARAQGMLLLPVTPWGETRALYIAALGPAGPAPTDFTRL